MPIVFYRHKTSKRLFSFGDDIREVPVCGLTLEVRQKEAIESNGCKIIEILSEDQINENQYFIFDDDLFFTREFVRKVLLSITLDNGSKQYCLIANRFNSMVVLPHSTDNNENLRFPFYFKNRELSGTTLYEIEQELFDNELILPDQIVKGGRYYVGRTDCFISRIASPFHLLQVNLAFNLIRTIPYERKMPKWLFRIFGHPGSKIYYLALKTMNRIGKNCQIHPTAIIEASVIGDNVCIGANSVIRFSYIGNGTSISENVVIINCITGTNNMISNSNFLSSDLLFNNVFLIHGPYQFSVFGNNSSVFAVINCDIRLDEENIRISTDVGILDSNHQLLGIAYGHHSKTGGGNIIAAGRTVPNHMVIPPPDNIILKFD